MTPVGQSAGAAALVAVLVAVLAVSVVAEAAKAGMAQEIAAEPARIRQILASRERMAVFIGITPLSVVRYVGGRLLDQNLGDVFIRSHGTGSPQYERAAPCCLGLART
jgi:hypothetical protein